MKSSNSLAVQAVQATPEPLIEEFEYPDVNQVYNDGEPTGILVRFNVHVSVLNDGFVMTSISDVDYDCANRLPI